MARTDSIERMRHRQRRALSRYLQREVQPFSPHYRPLLESAGLAGRGLASFDELRRLRPTRLHDIDPADLVLRPDEHTIVRSGPWRLRWGALLARITNQGSTVNRLVIEPAYKPIFWQLHDGVPVGYTSEDLDRLADLGRWWLELAGVQPTEVVVSLLPPGPNLAFWELALGARRAGVAVVPLGPAAEVADVARLGPTVLAGHPGDLLRLLDSAGAGDRGGDPLEGVTTILVIGRPLEEAERQRLAAGCGGAAVVAAWSPPGVRALWSECRDGRAVHLAPSAEVVEVVAGHQPAPRGVPGEVVWTGIGWRGTALVRLATGTTAIADDRPCPACGRLTPRLWPSSAARHNGDEQRPGPSATTPPPRPAGVEA